MFRLARLAVLVLTLALALATLAAAHPLGPNAARIARGLPPLPPKRAYDASKTTAHLARRSVIPGRR
ncbi:hypothetical protein Q5752_004487 [Cryptotrichosporon argae]